MLLSLETLEIMETLEVGRNTEFSFKHVGF